MLKYMAQFITNTFHPYLPTSEEDRLIGNSVEVEAHKNYGV